MARITQTELEVIISNPSSADLTPFITAANDLVTDRLGSEGMSSTRLKSIELFLAAHFATVLLRRTGVEEIGEARIEYQPGKLGVFLRSTDYGQAAMSLDTSGKLGAVGTLPYLFNAI